MPRRLLRAATRPAMRFVESDQGATRYASGVSRSRDFLREGRLRICLPGKHAVDHRPYGSHLRPVSAEVVISGITPPVPTALRVGR